MLLLATALLLGCVQGCYLPGGDSAKVSIGQPTSVCLSINNKLVTFQPLADAYTALDLSGCKLSLTAPATAYRETCVCVCVCVVRAHFANPYPPLHAVRASRLSHITLWLFGDVLRPSLVVPPPVRPTPLLFRAPVPPPLP
jgi:hypothetical protein